MRASLNCAVAVLASHAVAVIAASSNIVLTRCADKYQARPTDSSRATCRNSTRPAPSSASMKRKISRKHGVAPHRVAFGEGEEGPGAQSDQQYHRRWSSCDA